MLTAGRFKSFSLLVMVLMLVAVFVSASTAAEADPETEIDWVTYTDPRFDFTVEYPVDWSVHYREDRPGFVGGTVGFSAPASMQDSVKIEVGLYLVERNPSQSIDVWSKTYDANYDMILPDKILVLNEEKFVQEEKDSEAFRKAAISPLTAYTYVNVPWGRTVWFFWMNSVDEENQAVLEKMVRSMRFGENAPTSLQEAFGQDFRPLPLELEAPGSIEKHVFPQWNSVASSTALIASIATDYITPVTTSARIACGHANAPVCSGTHSGHAGEAIDIGVGIGTSVRNSATSFTNSAGWNNAGYGYLVTMYDDQNEYIAYYAHLSSINYSTLYSYWPVPQGYQIALSGDTGAGGAHLHFHVRTTGWAAVDLSNLNGLTLYSDYPNCGESESSCPGNGGDGFECTCGWIN